jgi:hypothetical protein
MLFAAAINQKAASGSNKQTAFYLKGEGHFMEHEL